jgi:hypothetical protein
MSTSRLRRLASIALSSVFVLAASAHLAPVAAQRGAHVRPSHGFRVGQPVQVEWNGQWYDATILVVERDGNYRIRYDGWSTNWDEPVPPSRIRVRVGAATPSPSPPHRPAPPDERFERHPRPNRPPTRDGNIVVNGGFEEPRLARGGWQVFPELPGWFTTAGPGIEIQAGGSGRPFEGRQLLELDSHAPTWIAQDLRTRRGTYAIEIAVSPRPGTPAADNRIGIYWDGELVARVEADGTGMSQTSWQVVTVIVRARSARTRLEIRDEGTPNSLGGYIDDVRVTSLR